eukprot:377145-Pleurochrysis_carterae.AAC.1
MAWRTSCSTPLFPPGPRPPPRSTSVLTAARLDVHARLLEHGRDLSSLEAGDTDGACASRDVSRGETVAARARSRQGRGRESEAERERQTAPGAPLQTTDVEAAFGAVSSSLLQRTTKWPREAKRSG